MGCHPRKTKALRRKRLSRLDIRLWVMMCSSESEVTFLLRGSSCLPVPEEGCFHAAVGKEGGPFPQQIPAQSVQSSGGDERGGARSGAFRSDGRGHGAVRVILAETP
ncbi:hypothetical protein FQA47_004165 [Oryzias melastigma]|uniref:Uncharacterized protein n=1 Tax=Oryzias melastigma TaxID=30732 RepID=A0A834CAA6_ORYME|nr:hypothetical protein FQA47_004165 [Oryzias melastigma]